MVEVRRRGQAIWIEDAGWPALHDGDLRIAQRLGGRKLQQRPRHGVGAVRATKDDDPPAARGGDDAVGCGQALMAQQYVRRQHASFGVVGKAQARFGRLLLPGLPAAQGDDRRTGDQGARPSVTVARKQRHHAVSAQMDRLHGRMQMQRRSGMVGEPLRQRCADPAHVAVDQRQRRKSMAVALHLDRGRRFSQVMERGRKGLRLETFEVGAAERIRADAVAAERAAQSARALDQGDTLVEPVIEQAALGGPQQRAEAARSAAHDDGRIRTFVRRRFSRGHCGTPSRCAGPPAGRPSARSAG